MVGVERSTTHSHSHAQRAASFETGNMEGSKLMLFFPYDEKALEKMVGIRGEARAPRSRVAPGLGTRPTRVKDRQVFA